MNSVSSPWPAEMLPSSLVMKLAGRAAGSSPGVIGTRGAASAIVTERKRMAVVNFIVEVRVGFYRGC